MSNSPKTTSFLDPPSPSEDSTQIMSGASGAALPSSSSTSIFPTTPLNLHDTINRLIASSRWIGNARRLLEDCQWSESGVSGSTFLKWKLDVPRESIEVTDEPCNADDNVLVSWVGQVARSGSVLAADGGWKAGYQNPARHKRLVRVIKPPTQLGVGTMWETQMQGARVLLDNACRAQNGAVLSATYAFFNQVDGSLRARSAMFKKDDDVFEANVPEECRYSAWSLSDSVRAVFDGVRTGGLVPQTVEAYDEHGHRIAPNDLEDKLAGAIVCVTCTLEKMLFRPQTRGGDRTWQVYANIVKLRVLESTLGSPLSRTASTTSTGEKRKADDDSNKRTGSPAKRRSTHAAKV